MNYHEVYTEGRGILRDEPKECVRRSLGQLLRLQLKCYQLTGRRCFSVRNRSSTILYRISLFSELVVCARERPLNFPLFYVQNFGQLLNVKVSIKLVFL